MIRDDDVREAQYQERIGNKIIKETYHDKQEQGSVWDLQVR